MKTLQFSIVQKWISDNHLADNFFCLENKEEDFGIKGFAPFYLAQKEQITFWNDSAKPKLSSAGVIFVSNVFFNLYEKKLKEIFPCGRWIFATETPYHLMVEFIKKFKDYFKETKETKIPQSCIIHPTAVIEGSIGENCKIGPNSVVMKGATLSNNCILEAGVIIYPNVFVGESCIFQSGVVVGSRGFGFYEYKGTQQMIPHEMGVTIGNDCSFGANMVIASGFLAPTKIGNNCHFDSLVQIAHNCTLGNYVFMASQSALAGSVVVGDFVQISGGAKVADHIRIGNHVRIGAKAGVTKDIRDGKVVSGFPAVDIDIWRRSMVKLKMLGKKNEK